MLLDGWLGFRLVIGLVGLTISLAIGGAELISRKIAVAFSKYYLCK